MAGTVILLVCCLGSGALFFGIGVHAYGRKSPMWFLSGTEIDPESVTDIPSYNRENGRMWKRYSLLFFLAGLLGLGGIRWHGCTIACLIVIVAAVTVGIWWLVRTYRGIRKKYFRPALDKKETFC